MSSVPIGGATFPSQARPQRSGGQGVPPRPDADDAERSGTVISLNDFMRKPIDGPGEILSVENYSSVIHRHAVQKMCTIKNLRPELNGGF